MKKITSGFPMDVKITKLGLLNWINKAFLTVLYRSPIQCKRLLVLFISFIGLAFQLHAAVDLEEGIDDFVLDTKKIDIPGYPFAYNPSIIRWNGRLLLSFRITHNPKSPFDSELGMVWLDDEFNVASDPMLLDTRGPLLINSRAEDGRLVQMGGKLYLVYSNNTELQVSKGGFRVHIAEVEIDENFFELKNKECLSEFESESKEIREKNWVPFDYNGNLMLAYSLNPHFILQPIIGSGHCESTAWSEGRINWGWGQLRGGTPAIKIDESEYLAFFHSSKSMLTAHSEEKSILHYFMGAYTFSGEPPFAITKISPKPIIGKGFYSGIPYTSYYWKKQQRVIFPGGYFCEDDKIYVAYGREDHEIWIVTLDRKGLMQSLEPIQTLNQTMK